MTKYRKDLLAGGLIMTTLIMLCMGYDGDIKLVMFTAMGFLFGGHYG